jgi:hypothetical protein
VVYQRRVVVWRGHGFDRGWPGRAAGGIRAVSVEAEEGDDSKVMR